MRRPLRLRGKKFNFFFQIQFNSVGEGSKGNQSFYLFVVSVPGCQGLKLEIFQIQVDK